MSNAPAGWYPDPSGLPGLLRYWEGTRWTDHVHQQTVPVVPPSAVRPGPTTPDGQPLAGWWHRVGATAIDGIFGAILSTLVTVRTQITIQREQQRLNDELARRLDANDPHALSWYVHHVLDSYGQHLWIFILPAIVVLAGQTAFLHLKGGTPGQLVTGLRTRLRERPGHLSWGRAAMRGILYLGIGVLLEAVAFATGSWVALAALGLIGGLWGILNPLWAAWDSKNQALHDKILGTNVVRVR